MKILGLTGPSGAGKGYVCGLFAECGIPAIDTDRVYHDLLVPPSPLLDQLRQAFSDAILAPDGTLDRAALAALVFGSDEQSRARHATLNRISHDAVIAKTRELLADLARTGVPAAIVDAPLLIEAGMCPMCDLVVAVLADRKVRFARLMERDDRSAEQLTARLDAQPTDEFYIANAHRVLYNNGTDTEVLRGQVRAMAAELGACL